MTEPDYEILQDSVLQYFRQNERQRREGFRRLFGEPPMREMSRIAEDLVGKGGQFENYCDPAEHDEDSPCLFCEMRSALGYRTPKAPLPRVFHRHVFAIEVVSDTEIDDSGSSLVDLARACADGAWSYRILPAEEMGGLQEHELLDEASAAQALMKQHSDPGFFGLDYVEPLSKEAEEMLLTNEMIMQFDRLYAKLQARGVQYTFIKAAVPPLPDIHTGFGAMPAQFDPKKHCFREDSDTNRCRDCGHPPERHTGCDCEES